MSSEASADLAACHSLGKEDCRRSCAICRLLAVSKMVAASKVAVVVALALAQDEICFLVEIA